MSIVNSVKLIGRITRDMEVKTTSNNKVNGRTGIAIDKSYQGADGQWVNQAMFVELIVWGEKSVGYAKDRLKKGTLVAVDGELDINNYTAQDGTKKSFTTVKVLSSKVLEKRTNNGQPSNGGQQYNAAQDFASQSYQQPQGSPSYDPADFAPMDEDGDIPF